MAKKKWPKTCAVKAETINKIPAPILWLSLVWIIFIVWAWLSGRQFNELSLNYFSFHISSFFSLISFSFFKAVPLYLLQLLIFSFFIAACYGYGRLILSRVKKDFSALEFISFSFALGLLIIAALAYFLAAFKIFYSALIWVISAVGIAAGILSTKEKPIIKDIFFSFASGLTYRDKAASVIVFLFALIGLAIALTPEIFYDSLVYHLGVPNTWLTSHGFVDMPYNLYSNLFMLHGLLFMCGMALYYGSALPMLINYAALVIAILAMAGIAFRYYPKKSTVIWASLLLLSLIQVSTSLSYSGTETLSILFCTTALAALLRGISDDNLSIEFFFLSGLFAGCAMAVKASCLLYTASMILVLIFALRKKTKAAIRAFLAFCLPAVLVVLPWLIKNIVFCNGNPFFPFATSIFGLPDGYTQAQISAFITDTNPRLSFISWLLHPWNLIRGNIIGAEFFAPLFIAFFPLLIISPSRGNISKLLGIFFVSSWLLWSFVSDMPRFMLPVMPASALLIAAAIDALPKNLRFFTNILLLTQGLVLLILFFTTENGQGRFVVFLNKVTQNEYLSATHNIYPYPPWKAINFANTKLPKRAKVLFLGESRSFYLQRENAAASVFNTEPLAIIAAQANNSKEMYAQLKQAGFTHLLFNPAEGIRNKIYKQFKEVKTRKNLQDFFNNNLSVLEFFNENKNGRVVNTLFIAEILEKNTQRAMPNYFEDKIKAEEKI